MLSYTFDNTGNIPLYEQLYTYIRHDIVTGLLSPQEKLPSKRSLADNLGVSTITIENAYSQLLSEGYIYSVPRKGFYVSDISAGELTARSTSRKRPGKTDGPSEACQDSDRAAAIAAEKTEFFADFSSNQTRPENFPFSVWARLVREVLSDHGGDLMTRSPGGGIPELREAIAGHLRQFRGMDINPRQVIIGAGTEYLYGLLIQLLGFHKIYAVEDPGYDKISLIYDSYRVEKRMVELDHQGIKISQLEASGADVVHISPSHHFPTGIVTSASRRYELLRWASSSDSRYIIEDDYDSEFRLSGKPVPALQSIDHAQKVIYINTFSKSLSSTMRISYMVLPEDLLDRFEKEIGFYTCTVSNFEQYILMLFIRRGHFEKHINRTRNYYRKQRDRLLDAIKKSPLSSRVVITEEDAGLHFLMKIKTDMPDELILQRAADQGIRIKNLSRFYRSSPRSAEHIFIINYSMIDPGRTEEAIDRLYRCLL